MVTIQQIKQCGHCPVSTRSKHCGNHMAFRSVLPTQQIQTTGGASVSACVAPMSVRSLGAPEVANTYRIGGMDDLNRFK